MTHNDARRSMKISMFSLLLILFCISTLSIVTYAKDGEILTDPNPPTISDPIKVQYGTDWYKEFWVNETDANSFVKRIEVKPTENVGNVEYKSGSSWSSFSKDADLQGPNWSSGSKGYVKEWATPYPNAVKVRVKYADPKKHIKFGIDACNIHDGAKVWNDEAKVDDEPAAVGGIVVPIGKFGLLAPYIGLVSTVLVGTVATAICVKRVKHRKEKQ